MRDYRETFRTCKANGTSIEGGLEEIITAFSGAFYGKLYSCGLTKGQCTSKQCPKLTKKQKPQVTDALTGELDSIGFLKGGKME
jgi:hypothetical protein